MLACVCVWIRTFFVIRTFFASDSNNSLYLSLTKRTFLFTDNQHLQVIQTDDGPDVADRALIEQYRKYNERTKPDVSLSIITADQGISNAIRNVTGLISPRRTVRCLSPHGGQWRNMFGAFLACLFR
jgi:hypothetical protein